MKSDIRTYLLTDETIAAAVSTDIFTANRRPQGSAATTYILIEGATGNELMAFDGGMGVYRDSISVRCISDVQATAQTLFEAVRAMLNRYGGAAGAITIHDSFMDEPEDATEPEGDGSDDMKHELVLGFTVIWEPTPETTTTTTTTTGD